MRLAFPWALLLLLPLLAAGVGHLRGRRGGALGYSSLAPFRAVPRTLRLRFMPLAPGLRAGALALLVLAAARPQRTGTAEGVPREGIAIEMVVDISSSMDISMPFRDATLSRMEVTKRVVEEFVAGRPNDLVGLVTFARYADTACPLTLGHDALLYLIRELKIESRPNEDGTAIGDALALAAARLRMAEEQYAPREGKDPGYAIQSKVVVLLTDGSNNCGRHLPLEAAALAAEWGIRVHTIALTDPPSFKTVQTPDGPVQVEQEPEVQEQILRKIAETTGGIYRRATSEEALRDVYAEIDAMETSRIDSAQYQTYEEAFQPFAAAGLALLAGSLALASTWLRRIP